VLGVDGKRLAKRHGDTRLSMYREQGVSPERIIGYLAGSLSLTRNVSPITAVDLLKAIGQDQSWLERLTRNNVVFDPSKLELH
jgi:glutamyl-tRNA synthetase